MRKKNLGKLVKRAAAFTLIAALGVSSLTACGKSDAKAAGDSGSKDSGKTKITALTGGLPEPYIWREKDGSLDGYDIAVFNLVLSKLPQYEYEYEVTSDIFTSADAGYGQVIVQHLGSNDERREKYLFSYPYYFAEHGLLVREDDDEIKGFEDLAGHKTEVQTGSFNAILFEKYNEEHPDNPIILEYIEGDVGTYQHVADGQTDFQFFDYISIEEAVEKQGIEGVKLLHVDNDTIPNNFTGFTFFVFPKDQKQFKEDFDAVLYELIKDGSLNELAEKYLGGTEFVPTVEQAEENH